MSSMDELVEQVQELENATTDLLEATNVSKQTLDEAVDSATGSAGSASTDAETATTAKNESLQARNEAVQAKDDAVAVVYEGDAILIPTPGSIPIADSKAKIDIGWLPFGEVNNPYSGVIGSVDKEDVIYFQPNNPPSHANQIIAIERQYNIAGRFVHLARTIIRLSEAEDTAERAIAFDDVFLDWNGNLDTYRSITPHRTSTGYDADQIAAEHGYSKVSNGLYKTGDSYALLLCRVARRNKGAYHPVWNPEGTGVWGSEGVRRSWNSSNWDAERPSSALDCSTGSIVDGFRVISPSVEGSPSDSYWLGRPDKKYHDAIYSDDVTPLYFSAAKVTDRQALLFDSFNKAVAGETFSGAESTPFLTPVALNVPWEVFGTDRELKITILDHWVDDSIYKPLYPETVRLLCQQLYYSDFKGYVASDSRAIYAHVITEFDGKHHWCRVATSARGIDYINFYDRSGRRVTLVPDSESNKSSIISFYAGIDNQGVTRNPSPRPQFLACDIIGSLDAIPQEWLDNGIPGNWLAVGEEGEDLIPDGTQKTYKASRKVLEAYLLLETTDRGATWSSNPSLLAHFTSNDNALKHNPSAETCYMVFYRTAANPFDLKGNANIDSLAQAGSTNSGDLAFGCLLGDRLINKVPVSVGEGRAGRRKTIENYYLAYTTALGKGGSEKPEHSPDMFIPSVVTAPAVKYLPYLSNDRQCYSMNLVYKEMKHNAESWGDDNKFNIVDNQTTTTDLNGETIIVGQKRVQLPYHTDGVTL